MECLVNATASFVSQNPVPGVSTWSCDGETLLIPSGNAVNILNLYTRQFTDADAEYLQCRNWDYTLGQVLGLHKHRLTGNYQTVHTHHGTCTMFTCTMARGDQPVHLTEEQVENKAKSSRRQSARQLQAVGQVPTSQSQGKLCYFAGHFFLSRHHPWLLTAYFSSTSLELPCAVSGYKWNMISARLGSHCLQCVDSLYPVCLSHTLPLYVIACCAVQHHLLCLSVQGQIDHPFFGRHYFGRSLCC